MNYLRRLRPEPCRAIIFDGQQAVSAKAASLRERAQRYRDLAKIFYNPDVVVEVEALASELENEAAELEAAEFFFPHAA